MDKISWGRPGTADQDAPLHQLLRFAAAHKLHVTSGEYLGPDGQAHHPQEGHNPHSLHYVGRAIDVGLHGLDDAEVQALATAAMREGINFYDERQPPPCGVWTGPHAHLSISPPCTRLL